VLSAAKEYWPSGPVLSWREPGGDTCRDDVKESEWSGKGRKLELICLDSGGAGGSVCKAAARLILGDDAGGVGADRMLAADVSIVCDLVGIGGVALVPTGPKTSSKVVSEKFRGGGDEKVPMISVLAVLLKKGLLPLAVDSAGLAILAVGEAGEPVLA
jgi:hypothetical protein